MIRRSAAPSSVLVPGRIHQKVISGRSHLQLIFSAELKKLDNLKINSLFSSSSPPTSSTITSSEEGKLDLWVARVCECVSD